MKGGEPFITLAVLDPNDHTLESGLDDLFADGVSIIPGINFPAKYGGKSANIGIGGNGLIKSRRNDEFGVAYAFSNLSNVLKDNIDLISIGNRRPQAEHQFEGFYNLHLTPWLQLTGDLQIIRRCARTSIRPSSPGPAGHDFFSESRDDS